LGFYHGQVFFDLDDTTASMAGNKAAIYNLILVANFMLSWIYCCVIYGGGLFESHHAVFTGVPIAGPVSLTTTFLWNRISNAYFGTNYNQYGTPNSGLDPTAAQHCNDASIPLVMTTVFCFFFCTYGIVLAVLRAADKMNCIPCFNQTDSYILMEFINCSLALVLMTIANLLGWIGCFMWEGLKDGIYSQWVPSGLLFFLICNGLLGWNWKLLAEIRNDPLSYTGKGSSRPAVSTGAPVSYPQSASSPASYANSYPAQQPYSSGYAQPSQPSGPPSHQPPPRGAGRI